MKKLGFACIWFGNLPNFIEPWLESCRNNPTIDFHFFTNAKDSFDYPPNVIKHFISFEDFRDKFTKIYDFECRVDTPYKMCDIRPAFGEVLQEYLKDYEFWGYCDEDLVWGDIRAFITDEILDAHDRILTRGHCSIYRNTPEVNSYYRTLPRKGHMDYYEILQNPEVCAFDEWAAHRGGGVSAVFADNGIAMYNEPVMADIFMAKGNFVINYRPDLKGTKYFLYENGKAYACGKNKEKGVFKEEVLYFHFQKRKIEIDGNLDYQHYIFEPIGRMRNLNAKKHTVKKNAAVFKKNARYFLSTVYHKIKK